MDGQRFLDGAASVDGVVPVDGGARLPDGAIDPDRGPLPSDGPRQPDDSAPHDAVVVVDGPTPDAVVDLDAGDADAGAGEDGSVGPTPDAWPADMAVVPEDAEPDWERPDARVLEACQPIVLPPNPPPSADGTETCNYLDDDGDGRVDEGFEYGWVGVPNRISNSVLGLAYVLQTDIGWALLWEFGQLLLFLDERGCPTSSVDPLIPPREQVYGDGGGNAIAAAAVNGSRIAYVYARLFRGILDRRDLRAYVQVFNSDGTVVGPRRQLFPGLVADRGLSIVRYDAGFAVYAQVWDDARRNTIGLFMLLDSDGQTVAGPHTVWSNDTNGGRNLSVLYGIAYDGEAFGMAWYGGRPADASLGLSMMRWTPDGRVVTPGRTIGHLDDSARLVRGLVWTGSHYVLPYGQWDDAPPSVAFIDREATDDGSFVADVGLGQNGLIDSVAFDGETISALGIIGERSGQARVGVDGVVLGIDRGGAMNRILYSVLPVTGGPWPFHYSDPAIDDRGRPEGFGYLGCQEE